MDALTQLKGYLAKLAAGGLCVAFSGGVDSAVLLKAASEVTENVMAVTVSSDFHPIAEAGEAQKLVGECRAGFTLINIKLPDFVMQNPPERCYLCKKAIFKEILKCATKNGFETVLDGTNADDLNEYRPGLKALEELKIISPLKELGITKNLVREMARTLGISVSEKPSSPCLATRIPYNTRIEPETLGKIDKLENYLKTLGFAVVRARVHGDLVRIEADEEKLPDLLRKRKEVTEKAKALGFSYVTLDLCGFRSGSWDARED